MNGWQSIVNLLAEVPTPLANLLAGILISLLTSWSTVRLALRRFQSEKWFERRVDAYTRVIESLHYMKQTTERQLRAAEHGYEIPKDAEAELIEMYRKGFADLRQLTDMGALIFSEKAVKVLDALNKEIEAATDEQCWWEHLDAERVAISKCLSSLRLIAKSDLKA